VKNNLSGKISLFSIIFFVILITLIPYIYGYLQKPSGKIFTGFIGQCGTAQPFYLAWGPKQVVDGHFLFEDKYNGYTEKRNVFNMLWLAMGLASKFLGVSVTAIFHFERVLSAILLLYLAYLFIGKYFLGNVWRIYGIALLSFSSGFGYLLKQIDPKTWTPDLWIVESNVFHSILGEVNMPIATALLFLAIYLGHATFIEEKRIKAISTGLVTLLLGTIYPYAVISVYWILMFVVGYKIITILKENGKENIANFIVDYLKVFFISIPIILYDWYLVHLNPDFIVEQELIKSPNLIQYFLSYGIVSILAIIGIGLIVKEKNQKYYFIIIWTIAIFTQIYFPLPFQMQLILGAQLPLVMLALLALSFFSRKLLIQPSNIKRAALSIFLISLLIISSITNIYLYKNIFSSIKKYQLPEYMDRSFFEALEWLERNTRDTDLVLSSPQSTLYIPLYSSNRVYFADYLVYAPKYYEKEKEIQKLFKIDVEANFDNFDLFLSSKRIDYIFFDEQLQRISESSMRDKLSALKTITRVFDNGQITIYRFNHST